MPRGAVKNMERIRKSREAILKTLMDGNGKDDVLTFENLGVDYLYVDEAHYYKNLYIYTKMNNVAGRLTRKSKSKRLKVKCEYLQETSRKRQRCGVCNGYAYKQYNGGNVHYANVLTAASVKKKRYYVF